MLVSVGNGTRERSHLDSVSSAADDVVARFEARKNLYVFSVADTQFYFLFAIRNTSTNDPETIPPLLSNSNVTGM